MWRAEAMEAAVGGQKNTWFLQHDCCDCDRGPKTSRLVANATDDRGGREHEMGRGGDDYRLAPVSLLASDKRDLPSLTRD